MAGVIIVFPKQQDGLHIRSLLMRSGFDVTAVCTSGTAALQAADQMEEGIIVCGYRFPDMMFDQLYENLEGTFEMLLLASGRVLEEGILEGIHSLAMPLRRQELVDCMEELSLAMDRRRKKRRAGPRQRSSQEIQVIGEAKALLMERNGMTEEEAHHYLQKTSMDSGRNMAETAQMLLDLMKN